MKNLCLMAVIVGTLVLSGGHKLAAQVTDVNEIKRKAGVTAPHNARYCDCEKCKKIRAGWKWFGDPVWRACTNTIWKLSLSHSALATEKEKLEKVIALKKSCGESTAVEVNRLKVVSQAAEKYAGQLKAVEAKKHLTEVQLGRPD